MDYSLEGLKEKVNANPAVATFLILLLLSCAFPLVIIFTQDTTDPLFVGERITSYKATVELDQRGQALVQEDLVYEYKDRAKAGFTRVLPRTVSLKKYTSTGRGLGFQYPTRNGSPEPIATTQSGAYITAKIGDKNQRLTGTQTYHLGYQINKFVIRTESADVVRWSPTDTTFGVPVDMTSGTIKSPVAPVRAKCVVGKTASEESYPCEIATIGTVSRFYALRWIEPGEGLFLELEYPRGTFAAPLLVPPTQGFPAWILIVLIHTIIVAWIWFFFGRDEKGRGTIVPNEELLEEVSAYEAGALLSQRPTYASFVGMLLDLAERRAIKFSRLEIQGILQFDIERDHGQYSLDPVEKAVLKRLFQYTTSDDPADGECEIVTFGHYNEATKLAYAVFEKLVYERLQTRGWYTHNIIVIQVIGASFLVGWTYFLSIFLQRWIVDPSLPLINIQSILLLPFIYFMPRLTHAGALMREKVQGLAWHIRVAEKARLTFHEGPLKLFKKPGTLVAYAVAMGIQKNWETQFMRGYQEVKEDRHDTF
ncbi:DUF2207 domain-containing protein [Patescibacteria group bacterium]|nr:DUF2207 domain-containing protein [Patescibacteria group bacterium]